MGQNILTTKNLCKNFKAGDTEQKVLINLDLNIYEGDYTVIMGSSGAGKSTLLYALSGMDSPTSGKIDFNGTSIINNNNDKLAVFR